MQLNPLGIITQPNQYGQYPVGALSAANGCAIRNPGILETLPVWIQLGSQTFPGNVVYCVLAPNSSQMMVIYFSSGTWDYIWINVLTGAVTQAFQVVSIDGGFSGQTIPSDGRFSWTQSRSRILITTIPGIVVFDSTDPSTAPLSRSRRAGLQPPALFSLVQTHGVTDTALLTLTACHCTALLRRKYADGYEIVSAPTSATLVRNDSVTTADISHTVEFYGDTAGENIAGDVIEIYRTKSQAVTTTGGTNTGSDFFLALNYTLTAADITAGFVVLRDSTPDTGLGEALYTNAGQSGAASAALPSPTSKIIATFKSYTFYLNRTDPPTLLFRTPVYWGDMGLGTSGAPANVRLSGIGKRSVKGTAASGNPTLTAVAAADIVGIVIGQLVMNTVNPFPANARVTAVGASSITFSANATSSGTAQQVDIADAFEMNGVLSGSPFEVATFDDFAGRVNLPPGFTGQHHYAYCLDRVYPSSLIGTISTPSTFPASNVVLSNNVLDINSVPMTVRATNGHNYIPQLPRLELNETALSIPTTTALNGFSWSEENQPENVPSLNTAFAGSGEIYAAFATRDALWIFASDGLWRLSGTGGDVGSGFDWRVDPVDSTISIAGPQAGCVLRDTVFAYTNRGLVSIDSSGFIKEISWGRVNDQLPGPPWSAPSWSDTTQVWLVADETNDEIIIKETGITAGRVWVYNILTDTFTKDFVANFTGALAMTYSRVRQANIAVSSGTHALFVTDPTQYQALNFSYQAVYANDPFAQRHWQQADFVFDTTASPGSITLNFFANGVSSGQRPVTANANTGTLTRTSFSITKEAPAIANAMRLGLAATSGTFAVVRVFGASMQYVDFTEFRKNV
jgi:hypothetical protein